MLSQRLIFLIIVHVSLAGAIEPPDPPDPPTSPGESTTTSQPTTTTVESTTTSQPTTTTVESTTTSQPTTTTDESTTAGQPTTTIPMEISTSDISTTTTSEVSTRVEVTASPTIPPESKFKYSRLSLFLFGIPYFVKSCKPFIQYINLIVFIAN